jgi:hypothetical protein
VNEYQASYHASEWVALAPFEWQSAWLVGQWIWEHSHQDGRSDREGWKGFTEGQDAGLRQQCLGSLCERVAAKALDLYWPSAVDNFSEPDLSHNVEVKLIGVEHYGLRIYPRMHDSRRVVGVVVPRGSEQGPYRVAGWYPARQAKRPEWMLSPHGRPPMFAVPQEHLRSLRELRQIIAREILSP